MKGKCKARFNLNPENLEITMPPEPKSAVLVEEVLGRKAKKLKFIDEPKDS